MCLVSGYIPLGGTFDFLCWYWQWNWQNKWSGKKASPTLVTSVRCHLRKQLPPQKDLLLFILIMIMMMIMQMLQSMNDVTWNYLWEAPLKLDLFPHILRPFTSPMFCTTFRLSIWLKKQGTIIWSQKRSSAKNSFILVSGVNFMVSKKKEGSSGCLSSIFSVLAGAQKWQLWSPTHSLRPLKMTPDGNWSYLGWHSADTRI